MTTEQIAGLSPADVDAIHRVIAGLESAWNNADGEDYSLWFKEDAEFVNVYGTYERGRQRIADGHTAIFNSIYKDSTLRVSPLNVRPVSDEVAIVHLRAQLNVPSGKMAGEHESLPSMTLVRDEGSWRITAFHNTFVKEPVSK